MATFSTKFFATIFLAMFSGKVLMNIPQVESFINFDAINNTLYNVVMGLFCLLWAIKFALPLYEKYREIRNKKY